MTREQCTRYQAVCLTAGCGFKSRPLSKSTSRRTAEIHEFKWGHRIVVRPAGKKTHTQEGAR